MMSNGAMNNGAPPPHLRNGSTASNGRVSGHLSTGSLNMPNGPPQNGAPRFDGPRSPPGKQNTSHVPCKFFRQNTCQAGAACPFSHDLNITQENNACKYFSKGNCKFGSRCANVHVLPNGMRVSYQKNGSPSYSYPNAQINPMNLGGRINPDQYHNQSSALTNGFMAHTGMAAAYNPYSSMRNQEEAFSAQDGRPAGMDLGVVPTIDTNYTSHQTSAYGSPRDDLDSSIRSNLGLSPGNQGLSILDAPLPPSFDSTGVSLLYRNGPQAASVPVKFGLESSPQSLSRNSEALKDLHNSVFGDDTTRDRFNGVPSSPPNPTLPDEYFGKRNMHSQQQRITRPKMMSSSMPKGIDRDWDFNDFENEEDCLPENLKDLLTPMEKARRGSRNAEEEGRPIYSGSGTPGGGVGSKVGSPSNASPSRWGSTFIQKQLKDEEEKSSRSSQFGHVGSPLRPSSLHSGIGNISASRPTPIARPGTGSGDASPYVASSPRRHAQVSLIAQGMQRVRLTSSANENGQHIVGSPGSLSSRITSNLTSSRRELGAGSERAVSSSSIGTGRFATTPIDEEQPEFVFDMDEDEAATTKRLSGGWGYPVGGRSPHLGVLGTRAPPTSGLATNGNSSTNGNGSTPNYPL